MVLQFVMGVNARLRPTPLCTASVPGECKASLAQVYRAVHYIMQRGVGVGLSKDPTLRQRLCSGRAVRAHRSLSHDRAFGGEAIVLVVLVCRGLTSVRRLCCLVVLTMHDVVLRRVEVDA